MGIFFGLRKTSPLQRELKELRYDVLGFWLVRFFWAMLVRTNITNPC